MDSGRLQVSDVGIARAVAAAVRRVHGVADVSAGRFAEAATYGPGEKVRGVAVTQAAGGLDIEVHLCALHVEALPLPEVAAQVRSAGRQATEALGAGPVRRIDVAFDDLRVEEG
jgi:uncharacterized alkaline shock family protein YloU